MGKSKTYDQGYQKAALFAKALAHPIRLMIIDVLSEYGPSRFGDVADKLPVSAPTVLQHIKPLKDAGIIDSRQESPYVVYFLEKDRLKECKEFLWQVLWKDKE